MADYIQIGYCNYDTCTNALVSGRVPTMLCDSLMTVLVTSNCMLSHFLVGAPMYLVKPSGMYWTSTANVQSDKFWALHAI